MAEALRYRSDIETFAFDEAATQAAITKLMRGIVETTSRDYSHAGRSVHAKSYALLEGELTILDNLSTALA